MNQLVGQLIRAFGVTPGSSRPDPVTPTLPPTQTLIFELKCKMRLSNKLVNSAGNGYIDRFISKYE
jgi:hypothetical protein